MFKKFICSILMLCMLMTCAMAKEDIQPTRKINISSDNVYTLSLLDAIYLATNDNPQLTACDIKKESNKISLNSAFINRKNLSDATVYSGSLATAYVKESYYVDLFTSQLKLADSEKEQKEASIAYEVTEKYFNYKLAERLCATTKQSYELALENKKTTDERLKLGLISDLESKNADVAVKQAKLANDNYTRSLDIAKEDLKIALQLDDVNCDFCLTDDIEFEDYESNVNEDIKLAMDSRYDTNSLTEANILSKKYFDITAMYTKSNTASYNTAYSDYIQNDYKTTNTLKQISLSIRSCYNSILTAKENLDIAEKNLEVKKQEYDAAKVKAQIGMITNIELTTILNDLSQFEINVENAKLTYKLSVIKYKYNITIGL